MKNEQKITVGSLFCGIGGFCKAFELEGASVLWATDFDKNVQITYEANYKNIRFILEDIHKLSPKTHNLPPVDILTAGFPCQPFSIAGHKRGFNDPRGNVFFEIIRIINEFGAKKPKIILLENVKNFKKSEYLDVVIRELKSSGYWIDEQTYKVLNTFDLTDLPQNRERLFMVAFNTKYFDPKPFKFPHKKVIHKKSLPEYLDLNIKQPKEYYFSEESQYYSLFKEKIDRYDNPGKKNIYLLRRYYVRPYLNGRTPTLTANMGTGGHNVPVIKDRWGIRKLTEIECARLQGFNSKWFKFPQNVSRSQRYKQIGNSVTVSLVRKLSKTCIFILKNSQ